MPTPRKNQKEVAQGYKKNLRYFDPVNPFRRARLNAVLGCLLVGMVLTLVYLAVSRSTKSVEKLNSPGAISEAHSGKNINCESCHKAIHPDPLKPAVLNTALDENCLECHKQHTFHQANVVVDHSCTSCHHEHLGPGPMQVVTDSNCTSCHGDKSIMDASGQKGLQIPELKVKSLDEHPGFFPPARPPLGYTQFFQSFESDKHPAFQIQRENLKNQDTLKFSHQYHLSLPTVTCADCHTPDSRGAYMQPINFTKNCQSCHKLQIDPTEPEFLIPHPTSSSAPNSVRNFLLTLPNQYQSFALAKGITDPKEIAAYVNKQMTMIRERQRQHHGADLVDEVYDPDESKIDFGFPKNPSIQGRAFFKGCVECHEIKPSSPREYTVIPPQTPDKWFAHAGEYEVTPPQSPDRWYIHAKFNHAAHSSKTCQDCHAPAPGSELDTRGSPNVGEITTLQEISLPNKASCVICHSTKGGIVSTCVTCHGYHNKDPVNDVTSATALRK